MTPQQKEVLKNSIEDYKKWNPEDQEKLIKALREDLKNNPDHKNSLPAKIFLRIHKKL